MRRAKLLLGAGALLTGLLVAACTAVGPAPTGPASAGPASAGPASTSAPSPAAAPPAACVLDIATLSATTGLRWAVDEATAGDRRCIYDTQPAGTAFVAVDVAGPADLATVAAVCAPGSSAPVGVDGFVCRLPGGGVYAARVKDGGLLTVAAAEIPAGTTADGVVAALRDGLGP